MTDTAGPHFVLGGLRGGTSPYYQGTYGGYWSSTAWTSATLAYRLGLDGTNSAVGPAGNDSKLYGFSLRCLGHFVFNSWWG